MDAHARRRLSADVARLADGDRTAFDPVFAAAWPLLRGFCGRVLSDVDEAEDAAQQALLDVFARSAEYDPARDALPWLLAIAVNECRTLRQRRARRREDELAETMCVPATAERAVLRADLAAAVREIVGDLPTADAETLRIVLDEAARPAVSPAAFRKRVERAMNRFANLWRTRHGTP